MRIRDFDTADAAAITDIYNHYILNAIATFEETAISPAEMTNRVETVTGRYPWLVVETDDGVVGYAYASAWHPRAGYRHTVEASIYLSPGATGIGYGAALYRALIDRLAAADVHVVIGGVALPNDASVAMHEKLGFRKAAHYREVGRKFDRWIDVGYWQLIFPPTSASVGAPTN